MNDFRKRIRLASCDRLYILSQPCYALSHSLRTMAPLRPVPTTPCSHFCRMRSSSLGSGVRGTPSVIFRVSASRYGRNLSANTLLRGEGVIERNGTARFFGRQRQGHVQEDSTAWCLNVGSGPVGVGGSAPSPATGDGCCLGLTLSACAGWSERRWAECYRRSHEWRLSVGGSGTIWGGREVASLSLCRAGRGGFGSARASTVRGACYCRSQRSRGCGNKCHAQNPPPVTGRTPLPLSPPVLQIVKVAGVALSALFREKKEKLRT